MKNLVFIHLIILATITISKKMKEGKRVFKKGDNDSCLINEETFLKIYNDDKFSKETKLKLRFIHGKCPPVLLVPGLFGSALHLHISDCEKFLNSTDEGFQYNCPNSLICKDKSKNTHEEKMWPEIS